MCGDYDYVIFGVNDEIMYEGGWDIVGEYLLIFFVIN